MNEWSAIVRSHPLFGTAVTFAAYATAVAMSRRFGAPALLHPVLVATVIVACILIATDMPYARYFSQALPLNQALGVVIVMLAVPLYRQFSLIKNARSEIAFALLTGSVAALVTTLALPLMAGASNEVLATLAPKSATAAVAVEIADRLGGIIGLTAVVVISTGIFGAVFGPAILDAVGVKDDRARGFALGVASHAIGTARAFQMSEVAGAFASLGMILNALLTVALVPIVLAFIT